MLAVDLFVFAAGICLGFSYLFFKLALFHRCDTFLGNVLGLASMFSHVGTVDCGAGYTSTFLCCICDMTKILTGIY